MNPVFQDDGFVGKQDQSLRKPTIRTWIEQVIRVEYREFEASH